MDKIIIGIIPRTFNVHENVLYSVNLEYPSLISIHVAYSGNESLQVTLLLGIRNYIIINEIYEQLC
jgi:hypothetical protein